MAGRQGKRNHGHCDNQSNQTKRSGRMRARVNLPFHRHREHQTAGDRKQITGRKEAEISETEGRVRIMPSRLSLDWQRNSWALRVGRSKRAWINWFRHPRAQLPVKNSALFFDAARIRVAWRTRV